MIERYLDRPRHLEIQILADRHGAVRHLGERECSLQRRHQKVVEEAPSPAVGAALRRRLGEAAVALARACGYQGAGTVEFIAPADVSEFFFLEMNTRLQVEHPVTELVYGIDLVEAQLRVAAGEPITHAQADLQPDGHAVEARLYAEDPGNGFLPATGRVVQYREPALTGVRVDSGVRAGSVIGTDYDPMLAKAIAHGPDRATALRRLDRALGAFEILGITTNAAFTRALLAREDVRSGELDTGLIERILDEPPAPRPADLAPAAALTAAGTAWPEGPWWRRLSGDGEIRVEAGRVTAGERSWEAGAVLRGEDGSYRVTLDSVQRRYAVEVGPEAIFIARDGHHLELRTERLTRGGEAGMVNGLEAPMPGTVLLVHVADGDAVRAGDVLVVLESMKMELSIAAPHDGVVDGLAVSPGDRVALKQPLLIVQESDS
jgi:acetyl-CoA/propionyl-CoA carboxylase biotin carboxyl carrier protein